jgi:tetratricopeptide (TPR) repeat protein
MKRSLIVAALSLLIIAECSIGQTNAPSGRLDDSIIVASHLKNPAFRDAWNLYNLGRGLESYNAFLVLFRESPGDYVVNFALGLAARSAGKFSQASMAFERILIKQPDNARVRLELALTYYRMNQAEMAKLNAERVLEANPPQPVADNVRDLLKKITILQSEWTTHARLSASIMYDSNPNAGPSSRNIAIAPVQLGSLILDTLTVGDDTMPQDSLGCWVSGSLLGVRDIGRRGSWSAFGALNMSHISLQDAREYDTTVVGALAGLELAAKRGNLQLPVRLDNVILSGDSFALIAGAGANYSQALDSGAHWVSGASLDYSDYNGSSARDSARTSLSQGIIWRFNPMASLITGVAVHHEKADSDVYTNTGFEPYVAGHYLLTSKVRLQGRLSYKTSLYDEKELLAPEDREDRRLALSFDMRYRVNRSTDAALGYQFTQNDSTFDIYEYDRNLVSISLNWRPL